MDKKSCKTCGNPISEDCPPNPKGICPEWQRNPRMWLSILPEEPGWYWFKCKGTAEFICHIEYGLHNKLFASSTAHEDYIELSKVVNGEWQGPIRPEG